MKKQAKDLLAAFRAGDSDARAEVQRFEHAADAAPNALGFALHDAQRVLARSYGFESWSKLKEHVGRVTVARLVHAVHSSDTDAVRAMLRQQPELVHMDMAGNDERRALHHAVLARNVEMVRVLMQHGADAHQGVYPHREATSAHTIASERGYHDVLAVIEEEERHRREAMSCPNVTVSPVQDEINQAIARGENATAQSLLAADESLLRACDRDGATPLHIAAQVGNLEMLEWMLARHVSVRKADNQGLAPLDRAALGVDPRNHRLARFPAVARILLARGAELNLRAAVALGDSARVRELVAADPGVLRRTAEWVNSGFLTLAVKHGQLEMVRLLLDLGADPDERQTLSNLEDAPASWGEPLWYAACAARLDIAELLLDRGADPTPSVYASGWPLDHAYQQNNEAMKQLLVSRGAKAQPWTLCAAGDIASSREMLAADTSEELAKEFAWCAADHGRPEILALCLPRLAWPGDDPRWHWVMIQPPRGCIGDMRAQREGWFECMRLLLAHGVAADVTSRFSQTTLHFVAAYTPRGGESPDAEQERVRFAAMLLDAGARLDARDDLLRSTPLGWAARWGRTALVKFLLERGAPALEPDAEPWAQPLAWAEKGRFAELAALLLGTKG